MAPPQRISFRVAGKVQGVFYRKTAMDQAKGYGLTGWVRNCDNTDVEGEAQGDEDSVTKLIRDLWHGPKYADVRKIVIEKVEAKQGETSFEQKT